jgi:16S rRNA (uracil1498-N3)-methyltransferase
MYKEQHAFFFISDVSGDKAFITKDEYRHACGVLRLSGDATLFGTDGRGNVYKCKLTAKSRETGEADIIDVCPQAPVFPPVHLYIGIPDREAFEEALTGLAALGAARIVPLICRYCQGKWWNSWGNRLERLRRKLISGIKQAHNPWLPDLLAPLPFDDAVQTVCQTSVDCSFRCVADVGGIAVARGLLGQNTVDHIACFIGPPGGFSPEELKRFPLEGFAFVKVAPYRLRTELAATVLCAEILQCWSPTNRRGERPVLPDVK